MLLASFTRLRTAQRIAWGLVLMALLLVGALMIRGSSGIAQPAPPPKPVRVTGTLKLVVASTSLAAVQQSATIALPDQKVVLRSASGSDVSSVVTYLDGRFDLIAPKSGTYRVCWAIATSTGCSKELAVGTKTVGAGDVLARLSTPVLHGVSLTGDNRPCWISDSFFGLDVSTAIVAGGQKVRANIRGEYAITGLAPGTYQVIANCEKAKASAQVVLGAGGAVANLPLPNHAPRLVTVFATDGAKSIARAVGGATVKLVAATRDADGDSIAYSWRTLEGSGSIGTGNGDSEKWTIPSEPGLSAAYVIARDGKGGYAYKRIEIRSGSPDLAFSGQVLDEVTRQPINGALVSIGSAAVKTEAKTDANGWFALAAKPQNDDRYVLNVTDPNHAPVSRVYDKDATGATYEMIRAQVETLPPGGVVQIVDTRSSGPCGGTSSTQGGKRAPVRLVKPSIYHAEGDRVDPRETARKYARADAALLAAAAKDTRCDPRGIQITVPAGALVYSGTNAPVGGIRSASASLNPARRALPGDYQAMPISGVRSELLSYGALYAGFSDTAGHKLNLKSGATAEIRIPVSDEARPSAPASIALWSYDDKTGLWVEEGNAPLQNTPQGWFYIGHTRHFSELNMDVAGTDPAHATCVRVELSPDFSGWSNLTLRAYVSYGGAPPPKVKETALDNHQYHAIFRIPFNTGFPNSLRLELRGTANSIPVVLLDNIINTDAPPHHAMTTPDLWPDSPYGDCTPVVLTAAPGVVPPYGDIDGFGRPAFLAGPYGSFNPANGLQQATDYYAALDIPTPKGTLGDWWDANLFSTNGDGPVGPNFVTAEYLNHNDLGFGRGMHCLKNVTKLACYVTNYGLPDQNPQNADDALNHTSPGATVAMEYDPGAPAGEEVQFYVYGGGAVRASARLKFADLDGFGPKPVPALCQTCHGGGPGLDGNNKASGAHFREFDLPSFRYPGAKTWDYGQAISATTPSAADFNAFAKLNHFVRDTNSGNEIASTINGWYPGGVFSGRPVVPPTPASWSGHANEYRQVYGQTCRTCHIARDYPDFVGAGGLATFQAASTVDKVCGSGSPKVRVMPNSSITYRNFWVDTPRVHLYETLVSRAIDSCKS